MATLAQTLSSDTSWGGIRLGAHLSSETYGGVRFGAATAQLTFPPSSPPAGTIALGRSVAAVAAATINLTTPLTFHWGTAHSVTLTDSTLLRECQDAVAVGCTSMRGFGISDSQGSTARSAGLTHWITICHSSISGMQNGISNPSTIIAYIDNNLEAEVEPVNEPNFMSTTVANLASLQKQWYAAVKSQRPSVKVVMSSVGNSASTVEGLSPMQWCQGLADAGCTLGVGFDIMNYHEYGDATFFHMWTPDGSGNSCQKIMGFPPFYVSEFGKAGNGITEQQQADSILSQMDDIKAQRDGNGSLCRGGWQYALSNDAPGVGTNYGLRRTDLTHKIAWTTFLAAAT